VDIAPFLAKQAFDQKSIDSMSAAFQSVCAALNLSTADDPATRFVAAKVIKLAQRGVRDPDLLREMTLREFELGDAAVGGGGKHRG